MDIATVRGIEHGRSVRLAVDAMGGDHAPDEVVAGALLYAAQSPADQLILVGIPERITALAGASLPANVTVEAASQVVEMDEQPALALRAKKDASILVATALVKDGRADAVITAGHTGAGVAAGILRLGRAPGVDRPALAVQMITESGPLVLLDIGATPDSTGENLYQYAHMGALFAERALGVPNPRIALLSIGEETGKGDARIKRATELLAGSSLNFTGNVEGRDLVRHPADVVVCDAVLGNVTMKFFEGLSSFILRDLLLDGELRRLPFGPVAKLLLAPGLRRIQKQFDYEVLGGSPLLGVRGTVVITHGRAKRRMIKHAIRVGAAAARAGLPELIAETFRPGGSAAANLVVEGDGVTAGEPAMEARA
jgi:glycerol-3-phosphate acyltransferase PlsX